MKAPFLFFKNTSTTKWNFQRFGNWVKLETLLVSKLLNWFFVQDDDVPRKNPGKNQKRWKKADLLEWLKPKNVLEEGRKYTVAQVRLHSVDIAKFSSHIFFQLWEIITPLIQETEKYTAEKIMEQYGVKCLRLPPYHPELNPMWIQLKFSVANFQL